MFFLPVVAIYQFCVATLDMFESAVRDPSVIGYFRLVLGLVMVVCGCVCVGVVDLFLCCNLGFWGRSLFGGCCGMVVDVFCDSCGVLWDRVGLFFGVDCMLEWVLGFGLVACCWCFLLSGW